MHKRDTRIGCQAAWYRMETGRNAKMGKNWSKNKQWPTAFLFFFFYFFAIFGVFFPCGPFSIFQPMFFSPFSRFGTFSILYQAAWHATPGPISLKVAGRGTKMDTGHQVSNSKVPRVTIRGAQPSARLSEEIYLSEGSAKVSQRALRGLSEGWTVLRGLSEGSAGLCGGLRAFLRFCGDSDPMLVTLGNCWI